MAGQLIPVIASPVIARSKATKRIQRMYGRADLGKGFFGISANGSGSGHVYGL